MKKTLFSLAFLAASAGYVAHANHGLDGLLPGAAKPEETATAPLGPAPKASASPALLEQVPAPASARLSAPIVALAMPAAPVPAPAPVAPVPAMPPLPRPRPADAPTIETAQATTVAQANGGQYRDGTYTGTDEYAYYGKVQVQVTVAGNQITSVKALDYPNDRRTSRSINSQALPLLAQEVVQAQNGNIDTVSGATLTSGAYIKSLGNALNKAAGGNA